MCIDAIVNQHTNRRAHTLLVKADQRRLFVCLWCLARRCHHRSCARATERVGLLPGSYNSGNARTLAGGSH